MVVRLDLAAEISVLLHTILIFFPLRLEYNGRKMVRTIIFYLYLMFVLLGNISLRSVKYCGKKESVWHG